jgi:hypothetical protein
MNPERILSLDISTKTGWSFLISTHDSLALEGFGQIPAIKEPEGTYPTNYVDWAYSCYGKIVELIDDLHPDVLVIEETCAGSKSVYSQKILEFIHFLIAKLIKETNIKAVYLLTGAWRSEISAKMTKEESKHNKYVKEYKQLHKTKVARDINGKRIGKLTKKHINIRRANEVFGEFFKTPLRKKDEDLADALLLGFCYHLRRLKNEQQ